jgi:dethiobiotin synthetase
LKFHSIFLTGTDTGVGKTTVACGLATALQRRGLRVGVLKPAETGCVADGSGRRIPEDAQRLGYFASSDLSLEAICPYILSQPLAPAVAADLDAVRIDLPTIARAYAAIAAAHDVTLVEGAGGLLVPLTHSLTFADLAVHLRLPVLLVIGNRLGAINHALLTARAVRAAGLSLLGYVVNALSPTADLAAQSNATVLQEWLGPALGNVPHLGTIELRDTERTRLGVLFEERIDVDGVLIPCSPVDSRMVEEAS